MLHILILLMRQQAWSTGTNRSLEDINKMETHTDQNRTEVIVTF